MVIVLLRRWEEVVLLYIGDKLSVCISETGYHFKHQSCVSDQIVEVGELVI